MKLDRVKFADEIAIFIARLATTPQARQAIEFAENNIKEKLLAESEKTGHPLERVVLVSICGELTTKEKQEEFLARLILMKVLVYGT